MERVAAIGGQREGADFGGLKHLLHISITDFDQCLH